MTVKSSTIAFALFALLAAPPLICASRFKKFRSQVNAANTTAPSVAGPLEDSHWKSARYTTKEYVFDRCAEVKPDKIEELQKYAGTEKMAPHVCYGFCLVHGSLYFGLQGGSGCWCGKMYGANVGAGDAKCNRPCTGDNKTFCGGDNDVSSIYIMNRGPCP
eukprot:gnl/TRDRNA2_/TRDRNA2_185765_c0_seq1.p1 gnl/TRDRNA2_/TRDRNA2_185765_c0~~gnl/TRDRNA2_/TRDRNA2_185765_c0_seq1.p1  ORF type:complete len:161 (+),score=29.41 gnl/TRDRNA2_/TRDRNA2_185765_c0_seq1:101-583(+)